MSYQQVVEKALAKGIILSPSLAKAEKEENGKKVVKYWFADKKYNTEQAVIKAIIKEYRL